MTHFFGFFKRASAFAAKASLPFMIALLATASQAQVADADKPRWYTGTLDGRPLFLRVFEGGRPSPLEKLEGVKAQYFFRDEGKWVTLRERADGWMEECIIRFWDRIECKAEGMLWRSDPGEAGTLNLKRRRATERAGSVAAMRALALDAKNPLCEIPRMQQGPRQTMGGISFAWVRDPFSDVKVLMLLGGLPEAKRKAFNDLRLQELTKWSCNWLDALSSEEEYEEEMVVQFASQRYLSVGGNQCVDYGQTSGCAYVAITFDLNSSKKIEAHSLFKRARDMKNRTPDGHFPLRLNGAPRNLDELIWQEVKSQVQRWPWGSGAGRDHSELGFGTYVEDEQEKFRFYYWYDNTSACDWRDEIPEGPDRPVACQLYLGGGLDGFKVMLTLKGLEVIFEHRGDPISFVIPFSRAAAVLKPGIRLH